MITSREIRKKYLDFFKNKWHKIVPSSSLIPENDPTTLFTGSWMQAMVPYLLWEKHPLWTRISDSQKCFRTWDIEEVWDNTHTTFFEMLWNWSFWDYFKKEQIDWVFEFLTKEIWLDPSKIYVSVYRWNTNIWIERDTEAAKQWQDKFQALWIEANIVDFPETKWIQSWRIFYYDDKENRWSRAWVPDNMPIWEPWWTDSEIFWDFWAELKIHENSKYKDQACHPNCDCWRFLEIWNSVFMKYIKTEKWFEELKNKNIDFWWGLERLVAAVNNKPDVFLWDMFDAMRSKIESISWKKYWEDKKETRAFRIIMDHIRVATFLIADSASPSNKDQWYFTRRVIRRAIRFAKDLWINKNIWEELVKEVIEQYKDHYLNLETKRDFIISEINTEEKQFLSTLEKWLKEFEKLLKWFEIALERSWKKIDTISWDKAFKLFDTYWFPIEMTKELAEEKWLKVDEDWFEKAFERHKNISRAWAEQKFKWWLADNSEATTELHSTTHIMLAWLRKVLWDHVHQAWSNITSERLRFDFTHTEKVTKEQLQELEDYVNDVIKRWCFMTMEEIAKKDAEKDPTVEWSFWEKYPEIVKVYTLKDNDWNIFSRELCWWPHIKDTKNMWRFKIKKEESSSKWIRRIKAVLIKD